MQILGMIKEKLDPRASKQTEQNVQQNKFIDKILKNDDRRQNRINFIQKHENCFWNEWKKKRKIIF